MGKPSWYAISHPGQLSLAIPLWLDAVSSSQSWGFNKAQQHTPVAMETDDLQAGVLAYESVFSQCKLVSG